MGRSEVSDLSLDSGAGAPSRRSRRSLDKSQRVQLICFKGESRRPSLCPATVGALLAFCDSGCSYCVEIRPLLVATIHRLPHRIIESIRPTSGTVSRRDTFRVPLGPSKTAKVPSVSLMNQPGIVV